MTPRTARRLVSATIRLQLHGGYTLDHVRADLPYFRSLGVSHLYLSPLARSRAGSSHGYDVIDHSQIDEARGGEAALRRLAGETARAGMGILLDIVPNHMATDAENPWWWDVLTHGRASRWADWYDIDWDAPWLGNKLLAPFLDCPYVDALRRGDIRLEHDRVRGWGIAAQGRSYPLAPASFSELSDEAATLAAYDPSKPVGRQRLHQLLEQQHYRLAWWRSTARLINWRRFFEETGLIGVRVERPEVFDAVHALTLRLYAEGLIDGVRIDHVDGLAQPLAYCRRLAAAMAERKRSRPHDSGVAQPPWIVVEKILAPGEKLDTRWRVSGTTGYDFCAEIGALLHENAGEAQLFDSWACIAADKRPPGEWVAQARHELLVRNFAAERNRLLDTLFQLLREAEPGQSWQRSDLAVALDAVLQAFPVYRTYVEDGPRHANDQRWFDEALRVAQEGSPDASVLLLLNQLERCLGGSAPVSELAREAVRQFQQLTPPLAAKSLEDTVFYRYGCLLSRNEVGSDPSVFGLTVEHFHALNKHRAETAPRGLLATATHDHKRGEDVRARLAVLSEIPQEWLDASLEWLDSSEALPEAGPERAFRYMLLQTLVGAWPPDLEAGDAAGVGHYFDRLKQWGVKALREGKQCSSWLEPDLQREAACLAYLDTLAPGASRHDTLIHIERFVRRLEPAAIGNGLIQTALRMLGPGIPDLYQGTEFRDFSLVDPDNRVPVDFTSRVKTLAQSDSADQTGGLSWAVFAPGRWSSAAWSDGRVKQALIVRLLELRRAYPAAFAGSYQPLTVVSLPDGRQNQLVAFSRDDEIVVLAAVKCMSALSSADDEGMLGLPADYWGASSVRWPLKPGLWRDALRDSGPVTIEGSPQVAGLLAGFPLAVLAGFKGRGRGLRELRGCANKRQ